MNQQQKRSVVIMFFSALVIATTVVLHFVYNYNNVSKQENHYVKIFLFSISGGVVFYYFNFIENKVIKIIVLTSIIISTFFIFKLTPEKKIHGYISYKQPNFVQFLPLTARDKNEEYLFLGVVFQMRFFGESQDRKKSILNSENITFTLFNSKYDYKGMYFVESTPKGTERISNFHEVNIPADGINRHETLFYNPNDKNKWDFFISVLSKNNNNYLKITINSIVDNKPLLGDCKINIDEFLKKNSERENNILGVVVKCIK